MPFIVRQLEGQLLVNGKPAPVGAEIPPGALLALSAGGRAALVWCEPFVELSWESGSSPAQLAIGVPSDSSVCRASAGPGGPERLTVLSPHGVIEVASAPPDPDGILSA